MCGIREDTGPFCRDSLPYSDQATYAQIPDELKIRELRVKVRQPGFRINELVLVTTLIDSMRYPKQEVADLFLQRWNVELDLRSIKDVLQMDVLRCKTPEMVRKEIWMHLLAYNLIRGVMAQFKRQTTSTQSCVFTTTALAGTDAASRGYPPPAGSTATRPSACATGNSTSGPGNNNSGWAGIGPAATFHTSAVAVVNASASSPAKTT
jgi:hypothetical protein